MKYEINSPWTRMRKADIKRLNQVIGDEYCIEREIGRKLNIMDVLENALDDALEEFNFDSVIEYMTQTGWEWSMYKDGQSYERVPTKEDIIYSIKENMFKPGLYEILECNKKEYVCETGGIVLHMGIDCDIPSVNDAWVTLYFDIAH